MTMSDFCLYVSDIFSNKVPEAELFNGYTTFMMCNNRSVNGGIKWHRMNWLINNYIENNVNANKDKYIEYYLKNIVDDYSGKYNPPRCMYNASIEFDKNNTFVENNMHYSYISNKLEMIKMQNMMIDGDKNKEYTENKNEENEENEEPNEGFLSLSNTIKRLHNMKQSVLRLVNSFIIKKRKDIEEPNNESDIIYDTEYSDFDVNYFNDYDEEEATYFEDE